MTAEVFVFALYKDAGGQCVADKYISVEALARKDAGDVYVKMSCHLYNALLDSLEQVGQGHVLAVLDILGDEEAIEIEVSTTMRKKRLTIHNPVGSAK